jgi:arabinofuranosyltransferase
MPNASRSENPKSQIILIGSLIAAYIAIMLWNGWLADDAFITMRSIDNFVNGYRLTWNVNERVQVFTHPLWMLFSLLVYAIVRDPFITLYGLSIVISIGAIIILVFKVAKDGRLAIISLVPLSFSKAFIDYSTSGLENPLSHLLVILYLFIWLNKEKKQNSLLWLTLVAALATTNRLDAFLIFLPSLAFEYLSKPMPVRLKSLLGFTPFIAWEIFATFYFGFPFPNTAYAKLNIGLEKSKLFFQGMQYFLNSITWDPITLITILISFIVILSAREWKKIPLLAGIFLYSLYVLWIGGDFMSGRFFSSIFFLAVGLIASSEIKLNTRMAWVAVALAIGIGLLGPNPPMLTHPQDEKMPGWYGISDQRTSWFQVTGLPIILKADKFPTHHNIDKAIQAKESGTTVIQESTAGLFGFYVGPDVYVIDIYALTNPLLARIPVLNVNNPRIGHFPRDLPEGYYETLVTSKNRIKDENLGAYYDKLMVLVRGDLFSPERLVEIVKFNLGQYDYYMDAYVETIK